MGGWMDGSQATKILYMHMYICHCFILQYFQMLHNPKENQLDLDCSKISFVCIFWTHIVKDSSAWENSFDSQIKLLSWLEI